MILWRNWGGWHALNVFFFSLRAGSLQNRVCSFYSYERKLKKRYCIAQKVSDRAETQGDYRKDNKAWRSVIFITKFIKFWPKCVLTFVVCHC